MLPTLFRHRELILRLVKRDLKVRYKSSVLGFLWSVAKPLLLVAIYTFVFDKVLGLTLEVKEIPFSLHVMAALLPWLFLAAALGESMHVILANGSLIKKIALPHEVFPVATVLGNLAHFLLALPVLFAFMAWKGIGLNWPALWLPALILLETVLAIALALILSALNVFYRDVASAFEVGLTAWFFATPIVYSLQQVARKFAFGAAAATGDVWPRWVFDLYMLNPMTPIALAYRRVLLYAYPLGPDKQIPPPEYAAVGGAHPDLWLVGWLGVSALTTLALLLAGMAIFRHYSRLFADEV
ncbi:MAG: ABC transporter permease [Candidatus Sumerlaeota bacterium]|nr:ABC transporter permease [Candidatus Sumerlaeota bacterium]